MGKIIKYPFLSARINRGTEASPIWEDTFVHIEIHCTAEMLATNEAIAKAEAVGGEYTIEDDGVENAAPLSIAERVCALERRTQPPVYTAGTWYYRGDLISFEGTIYTCIAPKDIVCVWSPAEFPVYWNPLV